MAGEKNYQGGIGLLAVSGRSGFSKATSK